MGRWIGQTQMTVPQWIMVPEHPRQRDTVRHAQKAEKKWLSASDPIQSKVEAVRVGPLGLLFKLEGHTRAWLWQQEKLAKPDMLLVSIYECDTEAEFMAAYNKVGTLGEGKSISDEVSGGRKQHGLDLTCALLRKNQFGTSLKWVEGICDYNTVVDIPELVGKWQVQIKMIDVLNPPSTRFNCTILSAMLLSLRKYGVALFPFWQGVIANGGMQNGKKMDAVRAACKIVEGTHGKHHLLNKMDLTVSRLLVCARYFMKDPMREHEFIKPMSATQLAAFREDTRLNPAV